MPLLKTEFFQFYVFITILRFSLIQVSQCTALSSQSIYPYYHHYNGHPHITNTGILLQFTQFSTGEGGLSTVNQQRFQPKNQQIITEKNKGTPVGEIRIIIQQLRFGIFFSCFFFFFFFFFFLYLFCFVIMQFGSKQVLLIHVKSASVWDWGSMGCYRQQPQGRVAQRSFKVLERATPVVLEVGHLQMVYVFIQTQITARSPLTE